MTEVTLSVVIGTCNRQNLLRQCLNSLIGKIQASHEIIVVDAGSTDGTLEYLEGLSEVRLVQDGKPIGQARSLNQVFRALNSTYICWLSDDNIALNGMLDQAVSILEQNSDIGMVALKVKDVLGPFIDEPYIGGILPTTDILNCNQGMIRTQLLRQVGYFDETLRDYGIDSDLTTKVLLQGYKVVYTKEVAIHHYRDHDNAPGAIDSEERCRRQETGIEQYKSKYKGLIELNWQDRVNRKLSLWIWWWIKSFCKGLKLKTSFFSLRFILFIQPEQEKQFFWNYHIRDWKNILKCPFISNFDLFYNRNHSFYLVQQIPKRAYRKMTD
jgi:GT2 family glycosyltransferase